MAADERLSSIATEQPFDELKRLNEGLKEAVNNVLELARVSKGLEVNMKGAATLKDVTIAQEKMISNTERARVAEIKLDLAREKAFDDYDKKLQKQEAAREKAAQRALVVSDKQTAAEKKQAEELSNTYGLLSKAYTEATLRAKNYYLTLGASHTSTTTAIADAKLLGDRLKALDASVGQYQRNVGNYSSATQGLKTQLSLVAGELPNIQFGFRTFLASLSNQFQGVSQAVSNVVEQNKLLRAEGKQVESLGKQLASAFLNWQTALLAVVAVGPLLFEYFSKSHDALDKEQQALEDSKKSIDTYNQKKQVQIDLLRDEIKARRDLESAGKYDVITQTYSGSQKDLERQLELLKAQKGGAKEILALQQKITTEKLKAARADVISADYAFNKAIRGGKGPAIEAARDELNRLKDDVKGVENELKINQANYDNRKTPATKFDPSGQYSARAAAVKAFNEAEVEAEIQKQKEIARIQKGIADNEELTLKQRMAAQDAYYEALKEIIYQEDKQEIFERQGALDTLLKKQADYQAGRIKMTAYEYDTLKLQISTAQKQIENLDQESQTKITLLHETHSDRRVKIAEQEAKELADFLNKNAALAKKLSEDSFAQYYKDWQDRERIRETYQKLGQRAASAVGEIANSIAEEAAQQRLNAIDEEIAAINKKRDAEIEAVNASALTEEQKVAKIAGIKAQAEVEEEELERKKRDRQRKTAIFEKSLAIAQIAVQTSLAVMRAYNDASVTNPAIRAANARAIAIEGGIQVALVLAAPIPEYEDGVDYHPQDGPARMFEGNKAEMVLEPGKKPWIGTKDGVYDLKKGAQVISNEDLMSLASMYTLGLPLRMPNGSSAGMNTAKIEQGLSELQTTIKNKKEVHINWTEGSWRAMIKAGQSRQERLNRNIHY